MSSENNNKATPANPRHPIPARSRQANRDPMDLSSYYNASLDDDWLAKPGANLAPLPNRGPCIRQSRF